MANKVSLQEAYVHGVSTRSMDDLVQAMGGTGISRSQVSRLREEIDDRVDAFLTRPIEGEWRSPPGSNRWRHDGSPLDRRHLSQGPAGWPHRVRRRHHRGRREHPLSADCFAIACRAMDGRREVLGMATGPSEAETFWTELPRAISCAAA